MSKYIANVAFSDIVASTVESLHWNIEEDVCRMKRGIYTPCSLLSECVENEPELAAVWTDYVGSIVNHLEQSGYVIDMTGYEEAE